jgi:hypothetical protein
MQEKIINKYLGELYLEKKKGVMPPTLLAFLASILYTLSIFLVKIVINSLVLTLIWNWFLPELGFVKISIPISIGLMVAYQTLNVGLRNEKHFFIYYLISVVFLLAIGFAASKFI